MTQNWSFIRGDDINKPKIAFLTLSKIKEYFAGKTVILSK